MTLFQFLGTFLTQIWRLLTIPFPATNVPIVAILIFPTFATIVIKFIKNILGGIGSSSSTKGGKDET